jgi:hypothetical protein
MEPSISLAVSVHSNKGVYALLLGSGVSRTAEIPTAWDITKDLIRRVAHLQAQSAACDPDPVTWYQEQVGVEPSYGKLLEQLASTQAERQRLLRSYFEPDAADRDAGRKAPTDAHRAIAELAAKGYIKVVLTTNFDHLLEQALEAIGVVPVVLSTPDAIRGRRPLVHSDCTIVKLHGDYLDARILNTEVELTQYHPAVDELLDEVIADYGLIVSGWSGESDVALRSALERSQSRRFSTYWAYPRRLTEQAKKLVLHRRGIEVPGVDADAFFRRLANDVQSLEDLAGPQPLSAQMAAQAVKRYLPRPDDRIRLSDLVMDEVTRVRRVVLSQESMPIGVNVTPEAIGERMRRIETEAASLMAMFAVAGYWSDTPDATLWASALHRLAQLPDPLGSFINTWLSLRRYPALLALYAAGIAAVAAKNEPLLARLLAGRTVSDISKRDGRPLSVMLSTSTVLQNQNLIPGYENYVVPFSVYLSENTRLRDATQSVVPDDEGFVYAFDRFEYLVGLLMQDEGGWAPVGLFAWRGGADQDPERIVACREVTAELEALSNQHPLLEAGAFGGSLDRLLKVKADYESRISRQ